MEFHLIPSARPNKIYHYGFDYVDNIHWEMK